MKNKIDFVPMQDIEKMLVVSDAREKVLLYLMAGTGLRVEEMSMIKVEDIDFEQSFLRLPYTKGGKSRVVVLLPLVSSALKDYLEGRTEGWLLPSLVGGHLKKRRIQYIIDDLATKAGIGKISCHRLRHSFAIFSLQANIDIYSLQKQLGHESILTTAIYLESQPAHRRDEYLRSGLFSA
jgi:site-specific recombinase XerD